MGNVGPNKHKHKEILGIRAYPLDVHAMQQEPTIFGRKAGLIVNAQGVESLNSGSPQPKHEERRHKRLEV